MFIVENFFVFNSLNFFSLIILSLLLFHATYYFKRDQEVIWKKVLLFAIFAQTLDIVCWYMTTLTGSLAVAFSYIFNVLLFTSSTALVVHIALFFQNTIDFSAKITKHFKRFFNYLIVLNFALLVLSVPFCFIFKIDSNNNYVRGSLYTLMVLIILLPLIVILSRLIVKNFKNFNKLLKDNKRVTMLIVVDIFIVSGLMILQGTQNVGVTAIFPVITISIFLLHIMLISQVITSDHLTSLQNKLGLELYFSKLPKILEENLVVIFFDLDKLKETNDQFGHKNGDVALKEFAQILQGQVKNKDIVARIGGDEFLIALTTNNLKEVDIMLNSIIKEVENYNEQNAQIIIDFSYGVFINERNQPYIVEDLIEKADKKMYAHKSSKK